MTTLLEAAKQAREALESSIDLVRADYESNWRHGIPTREKQLEAAAATVQSHEDAITNLTAAIDAAEKCESEAVGEVVWYDPRLSDFPNKPGKIVDCSMAFLDKACIGTKLYAHPAPQPAIIELYEQALKASWPKGAKGLAFEYWNEARKLLAAPQPAIPEGWQPIETAPKGVHVLLAAEFDGPGDWRIKIGGYWDGVWHIYGGTWSPTHWMPLPNPPKEPT